MIFRRIKAHVENENWFAVAIDFCIVVIGVFIGLQVANWNDVREARGTEQELIIRLESEFDVIAEAFDDTLENLPIYANGTKQLVAQARGDIELSEDDLRYAAMMSGNLGRPPMQSATYQQLVASGDLKLLRDPVLRNALVQYHQSVDRQAFFYPQTLNQLMEVPDIVNLPLSLYDIDAPFPPPQDLINEIVVDKDTLISAEGALEDLAVLQLNLLRAAHAQNELVSDVQNALEGATP